MNSLIRKSWNSRNKAQYQTQQLGSWNARPRIKTRQTRSPKNMQILWGHLRRNTTTSWTHNRRIWDKAQKAIIKESSHNGHTSMTYQHEISSEYHCPESPTTYTYVVPRGRHGTTLPLPPSSTPHHLSLYHLLQHNQHHQPPTPPPDGTLQITQ